MRRSIPNVSFVKCHSVFFEYLPEFVLKRDSPMMFLLRLDVFLHAFLLRLTD
jgi:hypothetical protein